MVFDSSSSSSSPLSVTSFAMMLTKITNLMNLTMTKTTILGLAFVSKTDVLAASSSLYCSFLLVVVGHSTFMEAHDDRPARG